MKLLTSSYKLGTAIHQSLPQAGASAVPVPPLSGLLQTNICSDALHGWVGALGYWWRWLTQEVRLEGLLWFDSRERETRGIDKQQQQQRGKHGVTLFLLSPLCLSVLTALSSLTDGLYPEVRACVCYAAYTRAQLLLNVGIHAEAQGKHDQMVVQDSGRQQARSAASTCPWPAVGVAGYAQPACLRAAAAAHIGAHCASCRLRRSSLSRSRGLPAEEGRPSGSRAFSSAGAARRCNHAAPRRMVGTGAMRLHPVAVPQRNAKNRKPALPTMPARQPPGSVGTACTSTKAQRHFSTCSLPVMRRYMSITS